MNLNIAAGHCVNSTVQQNITFSEQGLPFGLSKKSAAAGFAASALWAALAGVAVAATVMAGL